MQGQMVISAEHGNYKLGFVNEFLELTPQV